MNRLAWMALLLEVLIVLGAAPAATPCEAMLREETVAQIRAVYHVSLAWRALGVFLGNGGVGLYLRDAPVGVVLHARVMLGVDVDGKSLGML